MAEHARFRSTKWFGSLDGLRCISILAVVFHHTAGASFRGTPFENAGAHGVSLFFAISGFLITTLLLRERDAHGRISLRDFYVRRSLRIFPLYYTILAVYVASVLVVEPGSVPGRQFLSNLPFFATYTSNWFVALPTGDERVIFYFAWSLATEEQFYLLWPSVEKRLPRFAPYLVLVIVATVVLARMGLTPLRAGSLAWSIVTSFAPAIGLGVVMAHVLHSERGLRTVWPWLGARVTAPLLLLAMLAAIALRAPEVVLFLAMALLVAACAIREDHGLALLLRAKPVSKIGAVSYGMYLMHMLALHAVSGAAARLGLGSPPPAALFVCTSALAFGAAWLSYRYYESRFLALKRRFQR